jgi:RHS repeat-associated protein
MWYTPACLAAAGAGFIHSDHLGSTSLTTDQSGAPVAETRYLPYGEERWITGTLVTDFTLTGQRSDGYIKLVEMGARWYDPQIGRWISPDPVIPGIGNPQVLNHYSYVMNNPLRFYDSSGNFCWGQRGCAVVGAVIILAEGVDPLPIVAFARQLEEQYHIEGTLFYSQGANAPGLVDWAAMQ